jgi:prolyl-tRNA synthetase
MKFSNLFIPTTKETPKDATLPSHQFLIRAGFITQVGSGIYNYLPLGKMVLDQITNVVKEELNNAGAQEVLLGFVTPSELWRESGRFEKYGKELLRFKDRKENDFVLSPTAEEMMVDMVKNRVKSYKNLPLNLYQINTKFRDEARPRFGLLRGREFIMKDGYSFHESLDDMQREFALMEETYKKIITRLGVDFRVVEADSGAIGGDGSREVMVLADNGEDDIVVCSACQYAANIEAASRTKRTINDDDVEMSYNQAFHTPDTTTIEELSAFFHIGKERLIKAVAKKALYNDRSEIVIFFVRGDDDLQETKACSVVDANELEDISNEELQEAGIAPGFIGPFDLPVRSIIDAELKDATNMICGANKKDYHVVGASLCEVKDPEYADIIEVKSGDNCPHCKQALTITKGIEVGHIFQLKDVYSKPLNANFLDRNGKSQPFVMGTYGIGVSRLAAVIIEQSHDEKGCIWTKETAPFSCSIIVSNMKDEEQAEFAEQLYSDLKAAGHEVILDDRNERFGFKMGDFELIGFPYGVIVGKGLKEGNVQLVDRKTLEKTDVRADKIFEILEETLS